MSKLSQVINEGKIQEHLGSGSQHGEGRSVAHAIEQKFDLAVHPHSIERQLLPSKKPVVTSSSVNIASASGFLDSMKPT
jgi:hypothetical protein